MNKLIIIGNLTRDPELRTTSTGVSVCSFTVAVNRRGRRDDQNGQPEADFFRVTAWRERGEFCAKYFSKGQKIVVVGPVSVQTYTGSDGVMRASLEVTADEVEFASSRNDSGNSGNYSAPAPAPVSAPAPSPETPAAGFTAVETDELPF